MDSVIKFSTYTRKDGTVCAYSTVRVAATLLNISRSLAHKVFKYAVANDYQFIDINLVNQYKANNPEQPKPAVDFDQQEADYDEHCRYMLECGLTANGHDYLDC